MCVCVCISMYGQINAHVLHDLERGSPKNKYGRIFYIGFFDILCVGGCMYAYVYVCLCVYICRYTIIHIYTYIYTCVCVLVCVFVCVRLTRTCCTILSAGAQKTDMAVSLYRFLIYFMCGWTCVCVCVYVYIYIYIYIEREIERERERERLSSIFKKKY
jgi:hypothetical protein